MMFFFPLEAVRIDFSGLKNDVETHNCVSSLNKTAPYDADNETQLCGSTPK